MTKYFSFDIIHEYGAGLEIAIPDGVDNPQAVAQAYIQYLEAKGLLGIETEYLETQVYFVEEVGEQDFDRRQERGLPTLAPTIDELSTIANSPATTTINNPTGTWIAVADALPSSCQQVLVWLEPEDKADMHAIRGHAIDNYSTKYGFGFERDNKSRANKITVTHWMALTKPV